MGLQSQSKKENQDNWKDELPCDHPACHRLVSTQFDKGPEGSFAVCKPWLPVQLPHLRRLPWTGAGQLPLSRLNWSSLVLCRPPSFLLPGPVPLRQVPKQPLVLRGLLHPPEHSGAHHHHQPAYTAPVHQHPTYTAPVQHVPVQHAPVQHVPVHHVPVQHVPVHHTPAYTYPVHQPNHIHSAYTGAHQDAGP